MSNSQLDTVVGLFCRITNARFGKAKSAPCSLDLNEARYEDLGTFRFFSIAVILRSLPLF